MQEESTNSLLSRKKVFNFIGFFSAVSLGLVLVLLGLELLRGNTDVIRDLIRDHSGIEPFLIFMLPVIVIAGPVWLWRKCWDFRHRSKNSTGDSNGTCSGGAGFN